MKEKEKKPTGAADKSRTKAPPGKTASSRAPPSSTKSSSSAPKASSSKISSSAPKASSSKISSSAPKASSSKPSSSTPKASSSSKTSSSTPKPAAAAKTSSSTKQSSSTSKAPASSSKTSSSTSKAAPSSKTSSSSSKVSSSTSKTPSTSRSKPAAASSSSTSKSRSEKPTPGSTKTTGGGSRNRTENTSSSRDDKSKGQREPRRGENKPEKSSTKPAKAGRESSNQGRGTKPGSDRGDKQSSKASASRERGSEKSSSSRSQRASTASRKAASSNQDVKGRLPSAKSRNEEDRDKRKSNKENNREEPMRVKSSRSRGKSAAKERSHTTNNEDADAGDSGVEGVSLGQVTVSDTSNNHEAEVIEHAQNSLETMESGISLSSPRDLSGDEVDIEESISSKIAEVGETEEEEMKKNAEIIEGDSLSLQDTHGDYSAAFKLQNSMAVASTIHNDEAEDDNVEEDNDYEEDFEDYESDFEDDTGSGNEEELEEQEEQEEDDDDDSEDDSEDDSSEDEERGFEFPDPEIAAVLQALQEENNFEKRLQRTSSVDIPDQEHHSVFPENMTLLETISEDKKPEVPEDPRTPIPRPKTSRTFVNFAEARKKQMAAQVTSKVTSRGRILLNMIELDTVNVDFLTLSPISYEAYISSFGHSNRHQVTVQTNDDALCEEVQTEDIISRNKWTQKPVNISIGEGGQLPGPEDYIGVGGDMDPLEYSGLPSKSNNTVKLTSFLTSSSQVMLAILEEELVWDLVELDSSISQTSPSEGLGFSHPPVPLGTSVKSLLDKRPVPFVQFCATESTMLLSAHGYNSSAEDGDGELNESGLVCVWSVQEPSRPQHILCCRASPTAATFSPSRPSLVLSGLEDGSLAAWDLREPLQLHTLKIKINDVDWRVRVPSYVTACNDGNGEGSKIVAIQTVTTQQDLEGATQGSFQVVTLTGDGKVTWWVVVRVPLTTTVADLGLGKKHGNYGSEESKAGVSPHLGAAPWARVALNRTATISVGTTLYGEAALTAGINCHSLKIDPNDSSQLIVATGSGAVARCSRHNSRMNPKSYVPEIEPGCEALCLAVCPHDIRYILVGSGDGVVRLHSTSTDRPLTSWQSAPDSSPIVDLQWSPARPCVFYVLDSLSRLHVWDLSAGDIFPVLTVESGGLVGGSLQAFHIATASINSHHSLHAVFASDVGELVLRQISPEFCTYEQDDDYNTELERFTYYVNII